MLSACCSVGIVGNPYMQAGGLLKPGGQVDYSGLAFGIACPPQVRGIAYSSVNTVCIGRANAYSDRNPLSCGLSGQVLDGVGQKCQVFIKVVNK